MICSTSEQRQNADRIAEGTGGTVYNRHSKNIYVKFTESKFESFINEDGWNEITIIDKDHKIGFTSNGYPDITLSNGVSFENAYVYSLNVGDLNEYTGYAHGSGALSYPTLDPIDFLAGSTLLKTGAVSLARISFSAAKGVPALRAAYVKEVEGLSSIASKMRVAGSSSEEIARTLHGLRRELGVKYKSLTPDDVLQKIYQRNLKLYGDKLGPTIDYLRGIGKSWEDIINSATRTGGKDLGF